MSKHTPEPWDYRPNKHDDWGFIRDLNGDLVAVAKDSSISHDKHDEFRIRKEDPYGPNAKRIVACVNATAGMTDPEKEIREMKEENERLVGAIHDAIIWMREGQDGIAMATLSEVLKGGSNESV